jgi:ATP-dependent RNA helicase RhlE
MNIQNNSNSGFDQLGIAPKLLEILTKNNFTTPTPIQQQSIPSAIEGKDLIGIAQTGTGKTLAFGLPMIQRLAQSGGKSRGLIILPTRELAVQVNDSLKKIGGSLGLKTAILIGGEPIHRQQRALKTKPHIIIATPGRLIDHIDSRGISLANVHILVLDEADRMLDMGFAPQIKKILDEVPKERQTLLFSATMPDDIVKIANKYMSIPLRVEVAPAGTAVKSVSQEIFFVERGKKLPLLKNILNQYKGSVLVFSRTKHGAKKIAQVIRNFGETATEIHSNRSLNQRLEALKGFTLGKYRVLVATDIAARGIDVKGIQLVINYDLPDQAEDYVHRIGRTGRASTTGHAISFATHDQKRDIATIERLIRTSLPVSKTPELSSADMPVMPPDSRRSDSRAPRSNYRSDRGNSDRRSSDRRGSRPQRSSDFKPRSARPNFRSEPSSSRPDRRSESSSSPRPNFRPNSPTTERPNKRKNSEYERGRKNPPQSLKKISQNNSGFYINRKVYDDNED